MDKLKQRLNDIVKRLNENEETIIFLCYQSGKGMNRKFFQWELGFLWGKGYHEAPFASKF